MSAATWAARVAAELPLLSDDEVRRVGQLAAVLDARVPPAPQHGGGAQ